MEILVPAEARHDNVVMQCDLSHVIKIHVHCSYKNAMASTMTRMNDCCFVFCLCIKGWYHPRGIAIIVQL